MSARSLRTRLLVAGSAVLAAFVLLCGLGLERAFNDSALKAEEDRLQGIVYALLGAAEQGDDREFTIRSTDLPDARLRQPQSGLEAAIIDKAGSAIWRSPGASPDLPEVKSPAVGGWTFFRLRKPDRFVILFGLRWIDPAKDPQRYTFMVIEDAQSFRDQIAIYRRTLWAWLLGISAALLLSQYLVMRWGLAPLKRLVHELRRIQSGDQPQVQASYPEELTPLTQALNAMIVAERNQLTRYRNALGDLAHSLKTPLAVLRGLQGENLPAAETQRNLQEQVGRMQHIVNYQLRRAAAAGNRTLSEPLALKPVAEKLAAALGKVYAAKSIGFELAIPRTLRVRADEGDFYELLGNLLDNACKWARSQVRVKAAIENQRLCLSIEDDGPGFPDDAQKMLERGVRADTRIPGQGIGLAAVADLVSAYEGTIELTRSALLGGALVNIQIPV
jgi:two-component system sensor histidine kinase PhoQ